MSDAPLTHPTAEELRALSAGQLGDQELARISAHLADCPACCRRIDELGTDDSLLARLQQSASREEEVLVPQAQRRSAVRARQGRDNQEAAKQSGAGPPHAKDPGPVMLSAPRQVGDYDVLAEVGRGGMGVVYQARHRSLHRLAALKMILTGEFTSPTQELRFRLEAELAARVQHPNIVQVYEIGSYEGRPFLALEWVEGGSLANRLDAKSWPAGEAAALIETLARAIHVAHGEGIVHRDLKPANILLVSGGVVSGEWSDTTHHSPLTTHHPKITDFGLAQPTDGAQTLTQTGFLVGTPGYMAPEQASGKRALVGPATDIYALGVVLYQLLTGQLPFRADSTLEVLRAITSDEPVRPRRLQPHVPRDLEAITLHCLEKEPTRRYPSALALAEDLQRFREGRQVVARPVGAVARLARACRRRPLVALLLTLLTVSMFAGLAGVTWQWLEANAEKQTALYQAYRARIAAAVAALAAHDVADAARQLDEAPEELRGWEWQHLHSRLDDSLAVIPVAADGGEHLVTVQGRLQVTSRIPAGLRLTDLEGGKAVLGAPWTLPIDPKQGVFVGVPTLTRRGLRTMAWDGKTTWGVLDETGRVICHVERPEANAPLPFAVSPDGTRLVSTRYDGGRWRLVMFDAISGKETAVSGVHRSAIIRGDIWTTAFSPDGTRFASAGEDEVARVWDPATGALRATCRGHTSKIIFAAFSPDGARLATTSSDGTVRQWDPATGREVEAPYDRHSGDVAAVAYSPDGLWIASAGTDRTVRVWRAEGRQDVAVLHGHTGGVVAVSFAPGQPLLGQPLLGQPLLGQPLLGQPLLGQPLLGQPLLGQPLLGQPLLGGRRLASLSRNTRLVSTGDGSARLWEVDPQATLPVLRGHTKYVYPVAYSPDGRWIASGGWDGTARLWDAATGEPCAILSHPDYVHSLAFTPDGRWLVTGSFGDDRLRIWDVATACLARKIPGPGRDFRFLTLSPDGKRVAATADPEQLRVIDLASGAPLFAAEGRPLAYSPDGRWLAVVWTADDKTVVLLDAQTHETVARFHGHKKFVHSAVFSPDSRRLATCSRDHTVRLWQVDSGACRELHGHTDEVFASAFHPDGKRLATGGRDRAVWLWDLERGEEVARLQGHTSYVWSLAFSPDGTTLASGSGDHTVRLWDTAPLKTRYEARRDAAALRPEAERLVEQLWRQKNDPAAVVNALRADGTLPEPLRHAALRAVLRRTGGNLQ